MSIITKEMIKENSEELLSYPNLRKALNKAITNATSTQEKIYLREIRIMLDWNAEMALHSSALEEGEAEIYSILS